MPLNLGGIIRFTYAVKDELGAATNPGGATLTITQPDGTLAAGIVIDTTPDVTGQLVYDFIPTQSGLHSVHWATTGPTTAEDDMFVAEAPGSLLVSVDEAIGQLRAAGVITSDADREQLQWLCLVVSEAVEGDLGRTFVRRSFTETHTGGGSAIVLKKSPVASVTLVVEGGATLAGSAYYVDPATGILYRVAGPVPWYWAAGFYNVVVTYVAGYANPPRVVRQVALTALQSMWQSSQQAGHPLLDESAELAVTSAVAGLPDPMRNAYEGYRSVGVA